MGQTRCFPAGMQNESTTRHAGPNHFGWFLERFIPARSATSPPNSGGAFWSFSALTVGTGKSTERLRVNATGVLRQIDAVCLPIVA